MKAISFLGTGKYELTTYVRDGKSSRVKFFQTALFPLFGIDELVVFVTTKASAENLQKLTDELSNHAVRNWSTVTIGDGSTEGELWELFDVLVKQVQDGDDVLLDITHGFRSLPLLAFIAGNCSASRWGGGRGCGG